MADNIHVIMQFAELYGIRMKDVLREVKIKNDRTLKRMEEEKEFSITRTSDYCNTGDKPTENAYLKGEWWCIKINSIEELLELAERENHNLIISANGHIEIYDDYRE